MAPTFYDTHAHLDYPDYNEDFDQMLGRAESSGIRKIICIGTDLESSARAIAMAEKHASIFAVAGWHPSYCMRAPADIRQELRTMARHPKVVALGETGLDYHRLPSKNPEGAGTSDEGYKQKQSDLFKQHLEVAVEYGLNCVIHERDAFEDTIRQLEPWSDKVRGVFHCFVGTPRAHDRIQALGSLVSFTGICTFKNAREVRETMAATPLGGFMLETDCPYLAPVPYRGKRCEPAHVKEIAAVAAEVKNCSLEELSQHTCEAAHRFFPKLSATA